MVDFQAKFPIVQVVELHCKEQTISLNGIGEKLNQELNMN